MSENIENLVLDLIEWVGRTERTYQATMDAWRTSCPRLTVWEEATERRFVEVVYLSGDPIVRVTAAGWAYLGEKRPQVVRALL